MTKSNGNPAPVKSVAGKKDVSKPSGKKGPEIFPVEDLAGKAGIKQWELAGIRRYLGWPDGKQVSEKDFSDAVERFRNRPQGGGNVAS